MFIATAIKMKAGCGLSNNLLEIDQICLNNATWYKKERIHDYIKSNPGSIKVGSTYGPNVIPALSPYGEKYVKSLPNNSTVDNLLNLPRK